MKYSRTWSNLVHTANFDTRLARMLIRPLSLPWRGSESAQSRSLGWRTAVKMRHEASRSSRQTLRITTLSRIWNTVIRTFSWTLKREGVQTIQHPVTVPIYLTLFCPCFAQDYMSQPLPNRVEITEVTAKSVPEELPEAAAGMSQLASVHLKVFFNFFLELMFACNLFVRLLWFRWLLLLGHACDFGF